MRNSRTAPARNSALPDNAQLVNTVRPNTLSLQDLAVALAVDVNNMRRAHNLEVEDVKEECGKVGMQNLGLAVY